MKIFQIHISDVKLRLILCLTEDSKAFTPKLFNKILNKNKLYKKLCIVDHRYKTANNIFLFVAYYLFAMVNQHKKTVRERFMAYTFPPFPCVKQFKDC